MSMESSVNSAVATATSTLFAGRARVRSIVITSGATAGSVILKNGGTGGTELIKVNTPALVSMYSVRIPGNGVLFATDVHLTLSVATSVTIFYS